LDNGILIYGSVIGVLLFLIFLGLYFTEKNTLEKIEKINDGSTLLQEIESCIGYLSWINLAENFCLLSVLTIIGIVIAGIIFQHEKVLQNWEIAF
jgi:hypothetical protein